MSQLSFLEQLTQQRRAVSVSELTARLKLLVEREFIDVYVEGEISNFRRHTSGHWYFSLKDEAAALRCASFRMQNRMIRFIPEDGLHVIARGRLSTYDHDRGPLSPDSRRTRSCALFSVLGIILDSRIPCKHVSGWLTPVRLRRAKAASKPAWVSRAPLASGGCQPEYDEGK